MVHRCATGDHGTIEPIRRVSYVLQRRSDGRLENRRTQLLTVSRVCIRHDDDQSLRDFSYPRRSRPGDNRPSNSILIYPNFLNLRIPVFQWRPSATTSAGCIAPIPSSRAPVSLRYPSAARQEFLASIGRALGGSAMLRAMLAMGVGSRLIPDRRNRRSQTSAPAINGHCRGGQVSVRSRSAAPRDCNAVHAQTFLCRAHVYEFSGSLVFQQY